MGIIVSSTSSFSNDSTNLKPVVRQKLRKADDVIHVEYPWVYRNFAVNGYHTVCRSDRYWSGLWTDLIIEQVMMRSLKTSGGIARGRGRTESVRQLWIGSMHRTASVHDAMSNLTKAYRKTSEQHTDLSSSRVNRDDNDYKEVLSWFNEHDPFNQDQSLKSLSTGLVANESDKINCDTAELVGNNIQQSLDNNSMNTAKIKRGEQVRTLQDLQPSVKLKNQTYCNGIRTHNHLIRKRTLNHLAKLAK